MINQTVDLVIQATKGEIYNPTIIVVWALTILIFLGIYVFQKKVSKKVDFWNLWFLTSVASGILVVFSVTSPETISDIFNWIVEFI